MQLADAIHLTIRMTQLLGTKPVGLVSFLPGAFDQLKVVKQDELPSTEEPLKKQKVRKHPWTLTHGFYACMGGFRVTSLEKDSSYFPQEYQNLFLDPDGLILMAKKAPDLVPDISKDEIMDKSQRFSLISAIVAVQVTWFTFQVISRLAMRHSLTLLEINTFAHCICTALLPLIWLSKPRDIRFPHVLSIQTHEQQKFYAAAIMSSRLGLFRKGTSPDSKSKAYGLLVPTFLSAAKDTSTIEEQIKTTPERVVEEEDRHQVCLESLKVHGPVDDLTVTKSTELSLDSDSASGGLVQEDDVISNKSIILHRGDKSLQFWFHDIYTRDFWDYNLVKTPTIELSAPSDNAEDIEAQNSKCQDSLTIQLSPADRKLFQLAQKGFELYKFNYPVGVEWAPPKSPIPKFSRALAPLEQAPDFKHLPSYVTSKVGDWPKRWGTGSMHALLTFLFIELIYAAIHFLAWNGPFRTRSELLLWRIAVITLAAPALGWIAVAVVGFFIGGFLMVIFFGFMGFMLLTEKRLKKFWDALERFWDRHGAILERTTQLLMIGWLLCTALLGLAYILLYILAKGFIIIECLIQLAFIPDLALVQSNWTFYIPHFS
jgi:hypothetical protein